MSEPPTDWDAYQVPVDPSVPNPLGPTAGNGNRSATGRGPLSLNPDLQLVPLGGGYGTGRRRVLGLVTAALGAMALAVGLVLPWTVIRDAGGAGTQSVVYWDDYPNECTTLIGITAGSLALICAHRARYFVSALSAGALLLLLYTTGLTSNENATLNVGAAPAALHLMGPAWLMLLAGVLLNLVASVVQPPRLALP